MTDDEKILNCLKTHGALSKLEIMRRCSLTSKMWRIAYKALRDTGRIEKRGNGRLVRYQAVIKI